MTDFPHTPTTPSLTVSADEKRNIDNFCAAKNTGADNYEGLCSKHGWTIFSTQSRKCVSCRSPAGRPLKDEPRSVARRAGEIGYDDICEKHGPALFGVQSGKCLKCFTIAGAARKPVATYDAKGGSSAP